jgi:hypothetical protein
VRIASVSASSAPVGRGRAKEPAPATAAPSPARCRSSRRRASRRRASGRGTGAPPAGPRPAGRGRPDTASCCRRPKAKMAQFLAWTTPATERMMVNMRCSSRLCLSPTREGEGEKVENWKFGKLMTNWFRQMPRAACQGVPLVLLALADERPVAPDACWAIARAQRASQADSTNS